MLFVLRAVLLILRAVLLTLRADYDGGNCIAAAFVIIIIILITCTIIIIIISRECMSALPRVFVAASARVLAFLRVFVGE